MKNYHIIWRIAADLAIILLLALAPLWVVAICAAAFAWAFAPYYEIILCGLALDSLYRSHSFYGVALAFAVFAIIELLKKKTRI